MKGIPEGRGRVVLGSFYVPGYALPLTFDQGTAIRGFVEALSGMGSVVGPNTVMMKWVRRIKWGSGGEDVIGLHVFYLVYLL